jgi:AcrR family transcriptional regulator
MPAAKRDSPAAKRNYHHGDLRRALLDAAWRLVAEKGLAALTLRELARAAGVSHAAPYHHFPSRTALLDALAEEGFAGLDRAMGEAKAGPATGEQAAEAATPGPGDPLPSPAEPGQTPRPVEGAEVMVRLGRAYVDFACAHPEQLQVMFRPRHHESEGPPPPALVEIGAQAYGHLADAVRICQAQGLAPAGDPDELALSAWSLVHGFASLWSQGQLGALVPTPDQFARQRDRLLRNLQAGWQATAAAPAAPATQMGSGPDAGAPQTV